jgi:DNA-directed RNA polymerase specialized sigma24 family protein
MFDNNKVRSEHLMGGDTDWAKLVEADSFLYVFDRMPDQMRMIVDLKMTGTSNKDIANMLKTSVDNVETQLRKAKKRILAGENVNF